MTEVSVIMSTYKEPENQLRRSIESILNQTYKAFEYIIILDNPDNSDHIRIIKEYQQKDNRIQFHINEKNQGLTYSLNRGLSYANGKYICRMDADDISVPERLQWQKEHLEKCNVDLIGGITQVIDEEEKVIYSIKKIPANPDKILVFYKGFANHFLKQPAKMVIAHTGYFSGCCYGQLGFNMLLHVINYRFDPL